MNALVGNYNGRTALQAASGGGHEIIVRQLLEKGADMNAPGSYPYARIALQAALEGGHETIAKLLRDHSARR